MVEPPKGSLTVEPAYASLSVEPPKGSLTVEPACAFNLLIGWGAMVERLRTLSVEHPKGSWTVECANAPSPYE